MAGRECYHCKQWVEEGEEHDCWTTTEAALTQDLSEDLLNAWERLRETAVSFGDQRIYASHKSIMFSRRSCYFFVRPKRSFLELCVFLGRPLKAPQVRRLDRASKSKVVHTVGFNDKFWFDRRGTPHTGQLHTIERYTRPNYGTIVNEVTLEDAGALAHPVHLKFTARLLRPDRQTGTGDLMEFICNEDNQYGAAGNFRPGTGAGNK